MNFTNYQLDPASLPQIQEIEYLPIEKKYEQVMRISCAIGWTFPLAFFVVVMIAEHWMWALALLLCIALLIVHIILVKKIVAFRGYALREKDISQKKGLIFHRYTTVPFNRVQHVSVEQGIISRTVGLATLKVYTASGEQNAFVLKGLRPERAHELKQFILDYMKHDETN